MSRSTNILADLLTKAGRVCPKEAESELALWQAATADLDCWQEERSIDPGLALEGVELQAFMHSVPRAVHGPALWCAWLSGCDFLCAQPDDDEETFLVSKTASEDGRHRVYQYNPRQLRFEDKAHESIADFLEESYRPVLLPPRSPLCLDPIALARRTAWLTGQVAGVGFHSVADDTEHAPAASDYASELEHLHHPHLALYWLFHHYGARNQPLFRDVLERTRASSHPFVQETRARLGHGRGETLGMSDARLDELGLAAGHFFAAPSEESVSVSQLMPLLSGPIDAQVASVRGWWSDTLGVDAPELVVLGSEGVSEAEVARVEEELGQRLPPSFRSFLRKHGCFEIPSRGISTTPIAEISADSQSVREHLRMQRSQPLSDVQLGGVIAFLRRESDAEVFVGTLRDHRGECPTATWWHDDAFLTAADLRVLEDEVATCADYLAKTRGSAAEGIAPATTKLIQEIGTILAGPEPQRERLAAVSERGDALGSASHPERWTVAHLLHQKIKSKKVIAERDAVIARIRPDGLEGNAPLPSLQRTSTPVPEPKGFASFEVVVSSLLEALVEGLVCAREPS